LEKLYCKTKLSTIALILVLTLSAILVAIPAATAQAVQTSKSYPYIGAVPNPVGVNQPVLLHIGITSRLTSVEMGWEGLTVTVTDPDGIESTIGPIRTDATGGTGHLFTPTKVGKYILQTHFPTQTVTLAPFFFGSPYDITYLADSSEPLELVVQADAIAYYPGNSLPSEYWTRPIDAQLREWSTIAGSWLYVPRNKFTPYNDGPETAHILWVEPLTTGGIAGGALGTPDLEELGYHGMECGDAYEGKWGGRVRAWGAAGPIITAGRLYYTSGPYDLPRVYHCVDIRTGEELWTKTFLDNQSITFGQLFYWDSYNYHGVFSYLWVNVGSTWNAFNSFTGEWMFTIENVPSGTTRWGPKGEIYRLNVDLNNGWMALWNMSALGSMEGNWGSEVHLKTLDAAANTTAAERAWSLNVTIPIGLTGRVSEIYFGDRIISVSATTTEVSSWGLSLKPGQEGTLLFKETWQAPAEWAAGNVTINVVSYSPHGEDGVFVVFARELREYYGFSMNTGKYLWGPTDPEHYLNTYVGTESTIAYDVFISAGVSGIAYAYNATTGDFLWEYHAVDAYQEILWANSWWVKPMFVTDGKLYLAHMEHSSIDPKPRGAPFICLDMITGDEIWRADGLFRQTYWGSNAIIGDSIIATMDVYDQRVYAIGKGPSATTVEAPLTAITQGRSATIRGKVTDVSPGTEDIKLKLRFPNGVPAVADESMSKWMLYVYKQFECPADVKGVEVFLKILDPNGEYYGVHVTTDEKGRFSHMWTPGVVGEYHVTAIFEGSESYYPSEETTVFGVDQAPAEYPQPPTAEEIADMTADRTVSKLPAYPDVPSASEVAQETVNQMPAYPEMLDMPEIPAYLTIDLVIIAAVAIAIIIGIVSYLALRKQK